MKPSTRLVEYKRLSLKSVTLSKVAPEFVEAYRAYRQERLDFGITPPPADPGTGQAGEVGSGASWGEEARQVLHVAGLEAHDLGYDHIGTKHLLIALRLTPTTARNALQALGLETEQVREACRAAAPPSPTLPPTATVPSTPALRRVLTRASEEARALGQPSVCAGHLLLALLREPENEAVQFLLDLGFSPEEAGRRGAEAVHHLEGVMAADVVQARQGILPRSDGQ